MDIVNHKTIKEAVRRAVYVHKKFKHNLIIKVTNPSNIEVLQYIKSFRELNVTVDIDYSSVDLKENFLKDIKRYHIGLVIITKEMFSDCYVRKAMYEAHVPVLKLSDKRFSTLKDAGMILSNNRDLEKISATIFDISEQMGFHIEIYNYMQEHQDEKEQVMEHYYNLSTIFSKNIKEYKEQENPISKLKKKENFIQLLPFTKKLTARRFYSLFSTDSEKLYYKLDEYHQIFIPVQL